MNLSKVLTPARAYAFRIQRALSSYIPGGRVDAFGQGPDQISRIVVINLDRQPGRLRRVTKELGRLRTAEGESLTSIMQRLAAIDSRDGRSAAATSDVDALYRIGDQLHVQPDARLAACFEGDELVRMTRQEVAVARSHVEAWKAVAYGANDFVLVLEDDVWFTRGSQAAIDQGWRAALHRYAADGGPKLLYLSYSDAGGTALREDICDDLFRPVRGLWFLSGYVLSRSGAAALLRAMPVVGPVDLWMNFRFAELGALALSSPAIAQRHDGESDNVYSILPYLARAGIVDARHNARPPDQSHIGPVLAWTARTEHESLAMALSMLGLRVCAFDGDEPPLQDREFEAILQTFDALVDPPLAPATLVAATTDPRSIVIIEDRALIPEGLKLEQLPPSRSAVLTPGSLGGTSWDVLCELLRIAKPAEAFPAGALRTFRLFRDERPAGLITTGPRTKQKNSATDHSPWVLPPSSEWQPRRTARRPTHAIGPLVAKAGMREPSASFPGLVETFPGNLASFDLRNLQYRDDGAHLVIEVAVGGLRKYQSGAFASAHSFIYGHFEAEIRAARGPGLVTGFFLHRGRPRQEIDIELAGLDPTQMLINVYFNPGDDGAAMDFGYRGSPCWIDLGFDTTADFHLYAIDWQPGRLTWLVDGEVVHERFSWDPTPIPHQAMRLHANLWAPRSAELSGRIDKRVLPAEAAFRNVAARSPD
jgi:GR25 family glycosyltransferase involved in LPS biosynthesis